MGFSVHAREYGAWEQDPAAQAQRRVVWDRLLACTAAGDRLLDLGCGTGVDAAFLGAQGRRVVGIDAAPGMVEIARARGVEAHAGDLRALAPVLGPFDGAYTNFGVVNCLSSLDGLDGALGAALRPGAPLLVVSMPPLSPAWVAGALRRGRYREAWARCQRRATVWVGGRPVSTTYWSARSIAAALTPSFAVEDGFSLGLLLPPPQGRASRRWTAALDRLEAPLRGLPLLRGLGDHVALLLRRR